MTLRLDAPTLSLQQARKLSARGSRDLFSLDSELDSAFLANQPARFFARLARDVSRNQHEFQTLVPHAAFVNGKPRTIYRVDPVDAVVWSTVVAVLSAAMEAGLPAQLYSYRRGRSQWGAAADLTQFLRQHCVARPDPRTRGLYMLRRDVRRYDEHISTSETSRLWSHLEALTRGVELGLAAEARAFFERVFRPAVLLPDGSTGPLPSGIPTGIPTQTIGCNLYLLEVDRELGAVEGGFYARFGDDILFAHADDATVMRAAERMDQIIASLGLTFNPDKNQAFWLTGPGCPSTHADFEPVRFLPYLGFDVGFDGARLRSDKRRKTWLSLKRRLDIAERLMRNAPQAERAEALCGAVQSAFDTSSMMSDRYAGWLRMPLFSRQDLLQLDHHITLEVAQRLSGRRGVRAFREYPPRMLHTVYGLPSLIALWEDARRRGRQ